ncbi:hypothetical protein Pcinc_012264 [Petrolisthes cinctipes]|uniref:Uncharacterized protein n=1 Tax=Petrolisthes cinctipes TaxID=88211 RepID=A0AAE1KRN6_PETCI|nr:hypothetical protein Pcinc_012264 [Petrolisthes cinctipes]
MPHGPLLECCQPNCGEQLCVICTQEIDDDDARCPGCRRAADTGDVDDTLRLRPLQTLDKDDVLDLDMLCYPEDPYTNNYDWMSSLQVCLCAR